MNDAEVLEFLKNKRWDYPMKVALLTEYNKRLRKHQRPITLNSLSTPCRVRQVIGSLKKQLES